MLLITSDRGMVGAYHDNVIALATHTLRARALPAELVTLGKVGREAMLAQGMPSMPISNWTTGQISPT